MNFSNRQLLESMNLVFGDQFRMDGKEYEIATYYDGPTVLYGYREIPGYQCEPLIKLIDKDIELLSSGRRIEIPAMELRETNHSYCCGIEGNAREHNSWAEFIDNSSVDPDLNFLYRFDIRKNDNGQYYIELHFVLQRHGSSVFHVVVNNLTPKDMPGVERYLSQRKAMISDLWREVPLTRGVGVDDSDSRYTSGDWVLYNGSSCEILEVIKQPHQWCYHISNSRDIDVWTTEDNIMNAGL